MIWTACDTAVDLRARLRFPRAGDEPPCRLCSCRGLIPSAFPSGVYALSANQQLEATKQMKPTFTLTTKTRIINQ